MEFQYKQGSDTYESLQDRLQRLHSEGMQKLMREDVLYVPGNYVESVISRYTGHNRARLVAELNNTLRMLKFYTNNEFAFKDVHNEQLFLQNSKVLVEVIQLLQPYRIVESGDLQFLGDLFEQLLNQGFKQNEGQFFTPMPITRFIWKSLPLDSILRGNGDEVYYPRVIDYACGAGHFLTEGFERILEAAAPYDPYFQYTPNEDRKWVRTGLIGVEKDYRLARVSRISLYMHGAGPGEIVFGDGLENYPDKGIDSRKDSGKFDILTANPPYSVAAFKPHLKLRDNNLKVLDCVTDNGSEIETLFVERAAQLVRQGGYAAIILPSSILDKGTNSSFIAARDVLLSSFELVAIARFGSGTFSATSTNVAILFMRRFSETPTRDDCARDFVDAVFERRSLDRWRDATDLESYLRLIKCDDSDYREFTARKRAWRGWDGCPHFDAYAKAFSKSVDLRNIRKTRAYKTASEAEKQCREDDAFYRYAHAEEKDRLRTFALVCDVQTLVVNSPTSTAETAAFLGYKWSKRKGNEGLQLIDGGGVLYSDDPVCEDLKMSDVIRSWFAGESLGENDLSPYYYYADVCDFIDFDGEKFDKALHMPRTYYKPRQYASGIDVVRLGDVASYVTKNASQSAIELEGYVTTENMIKGRLGIEPYAGEMPATSGTAYQAGDTLVSNIRPYLQKVWFADRDGACSKDVLVFRTKDSARLLPEFLHLLLWQEDFFEYDMSTFTGTGRPRGDKAALLEYRTPLPSIKTQRGLLADYERLSREIDELAAQTSSVVTDLDSRFVELFGNDGSSIKDKRPLSDLIETINSGTSQRGGVGTMLISPRCIGPAGIDLNLCKTVGIDADVSSRLALREGDLLFIRVSGSKERAGSCVVCGKDHEGMVNDDNTLRVRLNQHYEGSFYSYLLNHGSYKQAIEERLKVASGQYSIDQQSLRSIVVPCPTHEQQLEFAQALLETSKTRETLAQRSARLAAERNRLFDVLLDD